MRASQTKALAALFLGSLAVFAVVCLMDFQDGSLVREGAEAHARVVKGLVDSDRTGNVLKSIRDLKAYSMAAKELLEDLVDFNDPKLRNGVVDFIAAFGVESDQDMVSDFAKTTGKLLAMPSNNHGVAVYLLDKINSRTLKGDSIVIKATTDMGEHLQGKVMLNYDKLGFEFPPEYLEKLAVRGTKYADKQVTLHQGTGGRMFELWEKTGKANAYEDMLARIEAKYSAKQHAQEILEYKGAKLAMKASFHSSMTNEEIETALHPLPTAGEEGADAVRKSKSFKMPTQEEMEAEAMEEAKKYMASLAADEKTPEALIAEMEAELEGVTVEVGTFMKMFADSVQQPTIAIVGKKGTIKGQLTALPAPGTTIKHNFPRSAAENIGHILRVELSADATGSPWLVSSFKLQEGYGNAWVEYHPQGSERLSEKGYWLGEEKNEPYWNRPHQKSWLLARSGQVEPVFRKSIIAGPPSCKDLECFHGTKAEFEAKCKVNPKCDGFTVPKETGTAEKFNSFKSSDTFAGCLKAVCHVDGSGTDGEIDPEGADTGVDYYQRVGFTLVQEKAEKANEKKLKEEVVAAKQKALASEKSAKSDEKAEKKIAIVNVGEHEVNAKKYVTDESTSKTEYAASMKERQQKWLTPYWDVDTKQGSCTEAPCAVHADQHCEGGGDMIDTKKGCQRPGTTQTGCEFQCQRSGEPTTEFQHVAKPLKDKTFVKWVASEIPACPHRACDSSPVVVSGTVTCHQVIDHAIVSDSMCIDDGKIKPIVTKTCSFPACQTCAGLGGALGGAQERCCLSYGYGGNGYINGGCANEIFSETGDYEERRECRNGRYRCRSRTATDRGCYWTGGYCAPNSRL